MLGSPARRSDRAEEASWSTWQCCSKTAPGGCWTATRWSSATPDDLGTGGRHGLQGGEPARLGAKDKYPRIVEFRDEPPMTATGKILERELT